MLDIADMLPSLYRAVNDVDRTDALYDDDTLLGLLKDAAVVIKDKLNNVYSVVPVAVEGEENIYCLSPIPDQAIQMLIVLKAALLLRTYEVRYSYRTEAFTVTRTSKREELEFLNQEYNELVNDYMYIVGLATDEWDTFTNKANNILSVLTRS